MRDLASAMRRNQPSLSNPTATSGSHSCAAAGPGEMHSEILLSGSYQISHVSQQIVIRECYWAVSRTASSRLSKLETLRISVPFLPTSEVMIDSSPRTDGHCALSPLTETRCSLAGPALLARTFVWTSISPSSTFVATTVNVTFVGCGRQAQRRASSVKPLW